MLILTSLLCFSSIIHSFPNQILAPITIFITFFSIFVPKNLTFQTYLRSLRTKFEKLHSRNMRTISCNIAKSTASRSKQNGTCLSLFLRDFFQKHFVFLVNPLTRICYKLVSIWFRSSFVTFKILKLLSKNLKSQKWVDYKYDCCLQQSGSPSCLFVIASCKVCLFVEVWRYNMLSLYTHRSFSNLEIISQKNREVLYYSYACSMLKFRTKLPIKRIPIRPCLVCKVYTHI